MGHTMMQVKKVNGDSRHIKVEEYGLSGKHHVLLEGVRFPPERRTAMAQSIGPMTAFVYAQVRRPGSEVMGRRCKAKEKYLSLRNQFCEEYSMVLASKDKSGSDILDLYKPKLWCYEHLLFLKESNIKNEYIYGRRGRENDGQEPAKITQACATKVAVDRKRKNF
ncbi:hypothetical protein CBL_10120 [Carabus blaptoides fortunei]